MLAGELTLLWAAFCTLQGPRRLEDLTYPGTSKGHFKGMYWLSYSTWLVVVTPSPHPVLHRALVTFLRRFSHIQPLLYTSIACQTIGTSQQDPTNNLLCHGADSLSDSSVPDLHLLTNQPMPLAHR